MSLATGYGVTFSSLMCLLRNYRKKDGEANPFISGAAAGLWVACEPPSRRIELTRIAFKDVCRNTLELSHDCQALFIAYNWLSSKNLLPSFPNGDTFLFCTSISFLFYLYQNQRQSMQGLVKTVFGVALGNL